MNWHKDQINKSILEELKKADNATAALERANLENIPISQENVSKVAEIQQTAEDRINYYERARRQIDRQRRSTDS